MQPTTFSSSYLSSPILASDKPLLVNINTDKNTHENPSWFDPPIFNRLIYQWHSNEIQLVRTTIISSPRATGSSARPINTSLKLLNCNFPEARSMYFLLTICYCQIISRSPPRKAGRVFADDVHIPRFFLVLLSEFDTEKQKRQLLFAYSVKLPYSTHIFFFIWE